MNTATLKEHQYKKIQKITPSSSEVGRSNICIKNHMETHRFHKAQTTCIFSKWKQ